MLEIQREPIPRQCPRCGGLMVKPAGSSFYWHAESNHPRCDITNIVDPPLVVQQVIEQSPNEPPKGKRNKK